MANLRTALIDLAVASHAVKLANDHKAAAQAQVDGLLEPEERLHAKIGGYDLATISRTKVTDKAYVDSDRLFHAWVEENHPEAFIRVIDPTWVEKLLAEATKEGAALVYRDGEPTGETIPGIKFKPSGGSITCNMTDAQREAFELAADEGKVSREGYVLRPEPPKSPEVHPVDAAIEAACKCGQGEFCPVHQAVRGGPQLYGRTH